MLNNFRNLQSLFWSQGSRWLLFRVAYALRKRTGYIRKQMPQYQWQDRPLATWLKQGIPFTPDAYANWRKHESPKFFFHSRTPGEHRDYPVTARQGSRSEWSASVDEARVSNNYPSNPQIAVDEAERLFAGELKYFGRTYYQVGFPPHWHIDPITGTSLDAQKHWSELSDDTNVDIKFIWEPSRFGMVYTLVRAYAFTRDERYASAFWDLIQSWAESNPPNTGPNWMDGQEAALRLLAWMFGYYQFADSPLTTPQRVVQFTVLVAAHAERIYKNIAYAISTHGNHTISEAFGLWLVGLFFPELRDAEKYLSFGRDLLEEEAAAQIFPDGTYSMYSLNYHRFILHLYLCVLRLAEFHQSPLSSLIAERVSTSIDYLSQLIDLETGKMPVYGSNDGALILQLNNCDFTDYRPLLQLGSYITKKQLLFEPGPWDEELFWLCGADSLPLEGRGAGVRVDQSQSYFPQGGTYLVRGANSKAILRCTDYRSRPSHADQLHLDLWIRGHNIACDAGTYLYSGQGIWRNGLAHTAVHNTVTVDHLDQMKMLTRFTWTNWSHGKVLKGDEKMWQGEHDGYRRLSDAVNHERSVMSLGEDRWLVVDELVARGQHHYALQWLLSDFTFERQENQLLLSVDSIKYKVQLGVAAGHGKFSVVRGDPDSTRGWRSQYYAHKEPAISIMLEVDQSNACFWSYFGWKQDSVELVGNQLKINSLDSKLEVNLDDLKK